MVLRPQFRYLDHGNGGVPCAGENGLCVCGFGRQPHAGARGSAWANAWMTSGSRCQHQRVANLRETQQPQACGEVFAQWLLSAGVADLLCLGVHHRGGRQCTQMTYGHRYIIIEAQPEAKRRLQCHHALSSDLPALVALPNSRVLIAGGWSSRGR